MSRSLGFMTASGDVDGVLKQLQKDLDYRGIVGGVPQCPTDAPTEIPETGVSNACTRSHLEVQPDS